jgi:hypothetical protein
MVSAGQNGAKVEACCEIRNTVLWILYYYLRSLSYYRTLVYIGIYISIK